MCSLIVGLLFDWGFFHLYCSLYTAETRNSKAFSLTLSLNTIQRKVEFDPLLKYPYLFQHLPYIKNGTEGYEHPLTSSTVKATKSLVKKKLLVSD